MKGSLPKFNFHRSIRFMVDILWSTSTRVAILRFEKALSLKNRSRSRTRVATLRFQDPLCCKNRIHSRTHVAILRFQVALSLKNRLHSRTHVTTLRFQRVTKSVISKPLKKRPHFQLKPFTNLSLFGQIGTNPILSCFFLVFSQTFIMKNITFFKYDH